MYCRVAGIGARTAVDSLAGSCRPGCRPEAPPSRRYPFATRISRHTPYLGKRWSHAFFSPLRPPCFQPPANLRRQLTSRHRRGGNVNGDGKADLVVTTTITSIP